MWVDFGLISLLLVLAHLLRSRVRLLQDLYLPTPLIAGLLALVAGKQALDLLPFSEAKPGTPAMASYPAELVAIIFATLFLGARKRSASLRAVLRNVGDTFFYNLASELGQYGLALLFGVLVLEPLFPDLNPGFALLLPAGFAGGHGTETVVCGVLVQYGWEEALSIGYTFATVGLLAGIFGGMVLINVGTRLGWTRLVRSAWELPDGVRRGFLPEQERGSLGQETVSPTALDPLAWHLALVLTAFALAHGVKDGTKAVLPGTYDIPLFALAMLVGAGLQKFLDLLALGRYVDRQVMARVGSAASDYLIAFGIASIQVTVVLQYVVPLTIMCLFGVVYSVLTFWLIGRRIFHNFWFERSLFVYGWVTGVVATGITLLRVVDPNRKTKTLEDYGLAYVFISPVEIALLVALPPLVAHRVIVGPALVLVAGFLACLALSRTLVGWFPLPANAVRDGEDEVIVEMKSAGS
jgi:ESS family glutamate:Na+ symporter